MTLGELGPGCRCRVRRLRARGVLCRRLMDLGFYPGVGVKVLRNAPLRDPVELEIDGYFLSIRRNEAHEVEVESHEA
ncbi:iron transporter FeoA [Desulfovibrio sulfodismutans]|uniref:Iron transporter FeoA n=2 Tax=Desulfolutivibrio sulfodismutans TaxID=63561 RepID=A0A7K3NIN9_9BACT|nr:FeoA domain-containing protein [Desulfolutivibrio sulfodismutans]NDY55655.1 iron transporter FeoA [Desulfolutivibrio sulfodismutans]QLA11649.1 iron transporter FeoA [Desulfolutivibrio sulfodismutans DSM 3696]